MDILFLCRDALNDSMIGNLALALAARKSGKSVGVIFTADALKCLCGEVPMWANGMKSLATKKTIMANAKQVGINIASPADAREIEVKSLLAQAREAGVSLFACPTWTALLELKDKLPKELAPISMEQELEHIMASTRIVGGL